MCLQLDCWLGLYKDYLPHRISQLSVNNLISMWVYSAIIGGSILPPTSSLNLRVQSSWSFVKMVGTQKATPTGYVCLLPKGEYGKIVYKLYNSLKL